MTFKSFYLTESNSRYLGSCVDVGEEDEDNQMDICNVFSDATEMANRVFEPDEDDSESKYYKEISKDEFFKYIKTLDQLNLGNKLTKEIQKGGQLRYFYDTYRNVESPSDASLFYIYNTVSDIHYFFKHTR